LAEVAWAVRSRNQCGSQGYQARVDVHLDVFTGVPDCIIIPEPKESEAKSAARTVKPGALHLYDRGFCSLQLLYAHYGRGDELIAHFVQRSRKEGENTSPFEADLVLEIDAISAGCGVTSDRIGRLPGLEKKHGIDPLIREVLITAEDGSLVRLFTSLLELPAHIVGMLYKLRWRIELFFKWLKCYANIDHLISTKKGGMVFHFYVVVVGTLLMYLHTDCRPSKYMIAMFGLVAEGAADLDEILPILRERERQSQLDRQSAARRSAKKKKK
jgi:Transposase DDE domain